MHEDRNTFGNLENCKCSLFAEDTNKQLFENSLHAVHLAALAYKNVH